MCKPWAMMFIKIDFVGTWKGSFSWNFDDSDLNVMGYDGFVPRID